MGENKVKEIMKTYNDTDYSNKFQIFNLQTNEEILNWSWFDTETGEYAVRDNESDDEPEVIKNHPFLIKENPYERHVWLTGFTFRQARRKLEEIEKSDDCEVLKRSYRGDRADLKVKTKDGEIINFRAFPRGSVYAKEIESVLDKVGASLVVDFKEVIKND